MFQTGIYINLNLTTPMQVEGILIVPLEAAPEARVAVKETRTIVMTQRTIADHLVDRGHDLLPHNVETALQSIAGRVDGLEALIMQVKAPAVALPEALPGPAVEEAVGVLLGNILPPLVAP
jgi:hypothetical protein